MNPPCFPFVKSHVADAVATVALTRAELHNAFDDVMISQITETFRALGARDDVRVVVLRSEGKSFSAGGDLNWMKRMVDYSFAENIADATALAEMCLTVRNCPKPVIARVHGSAYGGGVGLISSCDVAVGLRATKYALTEVKLGILPAAISPYVMEKIGVNAARRYFLTAEVFDAEEAHRIGLLNEICDTMEEVDACIARVIASIKLNGPEAMAVCKQMIRDVSSADWPQIIAITARYIAERRISAEGQEGIRAFLEKRKPNYVVE